MQGYRVVKRIQRRHGQDAHLLLCPYPGTGDAYLQGMYLPAYIEENRLANPVIVTNGRLVGKVLALFDLEAQEVITQDETDALNAALQFFGERLVRSRPCSSGGCGPGRGRTPTSRRTCRTSARSSSTTSSGSRTR